MGKLSWIMWVGPTASQWALEEGGQRVRVRRGYEPRNECMQLLETERARKWIT